MNQEKSDNNYFHAAKDWKTERYDLQQLRANRWCTAFIIQTVVAILLAASIVILLPLKTIIPITVYKNSDSGDIWVNIPDKDAQPSSKAQVESDLIQYIVLRETYALADLSERYKKIAFQTDTALLQSYYHSQSSHNPASPIRKWGKLGTRSVHVEDIIFLNKTNNEHSTFSDKPSSNLAKIDFTTTVDMHGEKTKKHWVCTIQWEYRGTPKTQSAAWNNWNGFTVTYYRIDQRNL